MNLNEYVANIIKYFNYVNFLKKISKEEWLIFGAVSLLTYLLVSSSKKFKRSGAGNIKKLLLIGDSVTAPIYFPSRTPLPTQWSVLLKNELNGQGIDTDIMAYGGKTAVWMNNALKKFYEGKPTNESNSGKVNFKADYGMDYPTKYDVAVIYTGINDAMSNLSAIGMKNLQEMVDLLNSKGTKVYVVLGYNKNNKLLNPPAMKTNTYFPTVDAYKKAVDNYLLWQKELPTKIKGATFIPKFDLGEKSGDGIHPSWEDHKIIKEKIKSAIGL